MKRNMRSGFTLLEILIVMTLIAILAGFLLPALSHSREKARQSSCINNLHQLYYSLHSYSVDWDSAFPPDFLADAVSYQKSSKSILFCPDDDFYINPYLGDRWADHPDKKTSYDWAGPLLRIGGKFAHGSYANNKSFMEINYPNFGLISCDHHGYLQNRIYNKPGTIIRLSFDGSIKTISFNPPQDTVASRHIQWSLGESLGWSPGQIK